MKISHIAQLLLLSSLSTHAFATDPTYCETKLFKQIKTISQNKIKLGYQEPVGDLKDIVERAEILCPWQLEADFNNDKIKDWVGIIYQDFQFQLAAYLSQKGRHELSILKTYKKFPKKSYLKRSSEFHVNEQFNQLKNKYFADSLILEIDLSANTNIYGWDAKKLSVIHTYKTEIPKRNADNENSMEEQEPDEKSQNIWR